MLRTGGTSAFCRIRRLVSVEKHDTVPVTFEGVVVPVKIKLLDFIDDEDVSEGDKPVKDELGTSEVG